MVDVLLFDSMETVLLDQGPGDDEYFYDKWDSFRDIIDGRVNPYNLPSDTLKKLMTFAKDQGNYMFKKKLFPYAHELYLLGTLIAEDLRAKGVTDVDLEFVSVLYANLAFSKIKLDRFSEAVDSAQTAIGINCDNVKAYYRLVVSFKALHRYDKAMDAARTGERKAYEKGMTGDVRQFEDLCKELEVHIPPAPVRTMEQPVKSRLSQPQAKTGNHAHVGPSLNKTHGGRSAVVSISRTLDSGTSQGASPACPTMTTSELDNSWLKGTNIQQNKKLQEQRKQVTSKYKNKNKKGKKVVSVKALPAPASSSSSEEEYEEEESSEMEMESSDQESEEEDVRYSYVLPPNSTQNRFETMHHLQAIKKDNTFSMGLDDFESPPSRPKAPVKTTAKSPVKPAKPQPPPLPMSLVAKYETGLACSTCYVKESEGMLGSHYHEKGAHNCGRDILLTRSKKDSNALWLKIRARPQRMSTKTIFKGKFRLCSQYQMCEPCKIGEANCTFAHSDTEIEFWTADGNGEFSIPDYISQLRKLPPDVTVVSSKPDIAPVPGAAKASAAPATSQSQSLNLAPRLTFMNGIKPLMEQPTEVRGPSPPLGQSRPPLLPTPAPLPNVRPLIPPDNIIHSRPPPLLRHPIAHPNNPNGPPFNPRYGMPPFPGGFPSNGNHPPIPSRFNSESHPGLNNIPPRGPPPSLLQSGVSLIEISGGPSQLYKPYTQHYPGPLRQQPGPPYQHNNHHSGPMMGPPPHNGPPHLIMYQQQQHNAPPWRDYDSDRHNHMDGKASEENLRFPLEKSHDYILVCTQCLYETKDIGIHMINLQLQHNCDENTLAVKLKGNKTWVMIRERLNHRHFSGRYNLCRYYCNTPPQPCTKFMGNCSFAHSLEEQFLWGLEKDDRFSIRAFILANSKQTKSDMARVEELFRKHSGQFRFLCGACFEGRPCRIVFAHANHADLCATGLHKWSITRLLIHVNLQGKITPIAPRPFIHKAAFFGMCAAMQYCSRRVTSRCMFAHSGVERDVWYVEKDNELNRNEIVQASLDFQTRIAQERNLATTQSSYSNGSNSSRSDTPETQPTPPLQNLAPAVVRCPYHVIHVCEVCWKKGQKRTQKGDRCNGPGNGHLWAHNKICMLVPQNKQIRPLPLKIPNYCKFIVCRHIQAKRACEYSSGHCQFAHSQQEVDVWTWMVKNNVKTLDELISISGKNHESAADSSTTKKIHQGQSVVSAARVATPPLPAGLNLQSNSQYCKYCGVMCANRRIWDEHCASEQHMFNVNSDREHQWNYRQPPWGLVASAYQLCGAHKLNMCQYSHQPESYNQCQFAHSPEELDEWLERWRWRQMKREVAKQEGVYSYMEQLLEDYESADSGISVITEMIAGVECSCDQSLSAYHQDKSADIIWTFRIKASKTMHLEKVALIHNDDRLHFSLDAPDSGAHTQIADGAVFMSSSKKSYSITVKFSGGMFGSFMQWIIFDFGGRPVLRRKLSVELGTQDNQQKVREMRRELSFHRWTGDNRQVVRFDSRQLHKQNEEEERLLKQYKSPSSADTVITQQSLLTVLNRHNYQHKMHKLLKMEELARHQIIASYNLKTTIELMEQINEGTMIFVMPGELFARVPLNEQLSEDTNAGKLILTSVSRVWVAPQGHSGQVVYEAVIVDRENFDYDGRGKDYIYMCLSPSCVNGLKLQKGQSLAMEIQFQMSRLPFCRMHRAVDLLQDTKTVFPDLSLVTNRQRHTLNISSNVLNEDQVAIIRHTVTESNGYTPPLIIYGSFGTGKSETLAQAIMLLLKSRPNARILLCTHSNSAADLYISKHLDTFARDNPGMKMLRIYQEARRLNTVPPVIQKYCLVSADRSRFELPRPSDIRNHHVVITTLSMALYLASHAELVGHFQHILIDEAAQALECEAIMPLSLANDNTCVVLAGDHMQMSPKVYSAAARQQGLHESLLQRLFQHYSNLSSTYRLQTNNILLRKNYRTRMPILRFIAATFYGGPDRLECRSSQQECAVPALRFFAAHGHEVQDPDKTSYYNIAEIEETVQRVADLYASWPAEWGTPDARKIGVVTPYYEHVTRLRACLRRKRKELGQVTVERVMNVQGKEFLALFITTVRTRHLLESPPSFMAEGSECDGECGDLGFLSDGKLLNTALTRAQSSVSVIGDPLALCIIGQSMNIWRTYLKHCQKMGTIYPNTITLQTVQAQVRSLMNSPLGTNLQKMAELSKQGLSTSPQRPTQKLNTTEQNDNRTTTSASMLREPVKQPTPDTSSTDEDELEESDDEEDTEESGEDMSDEIGIMSDDGFFDDWSEDYQVEPDEIIKQIAFKTMTNTQKKSVWAAPPQRSISQEPQSPLDLATPIKMEDVQVTNHHGHAVVHYKPHSERYTTNKQRKLLSANDYEKQFNSDDDGSDGEEAENRGSDRTIYQDYSLQQLKDMLSHEPNRYKHCILKIESSMSMYALDQDPHSGHKKLRISSRLRCGRGFNNDEVVVEVIQSEDEDRSAQDSTEQDEAQGNVVGILRRAINPKYRMFVCTVEEGNTGLMVPLNRGIPKIFNLLTPHHHNKAKKGHVCVYTFAKNKEITFHHWEPVNQTDPGSKLFIVRYLKWDAQCYSPLGIVVGVLPAGTTVEDGMKILNLEHYIPKKFKEECEQECERIYHPHYIIPNHVLVSRHDYRRRLTFTIDCPEAQDLDDALSIESLPGDCYQIGIHIADVSYFVKAGSYIDAEARARGFTHYPAGQQPIPMIPNRLSTDLCSLKPGEDRLTISLILRVSHQGEVLSVDPQRSVIMSSHRLTYEEVESVLNDENDDYSEQVVDSLIMLQRISELWRKKRLGNASLYHQLDSEAALAPKAYMLVEEMMITANHQVAKLLLDRFPNTTLLRQQLPPNELELALWRSLHQKQALQSVALSRAFLPKGEVCKCKEECSCVQPVAFEPGTDYVSVSLPTWEQLKEAVEEADTDAMQNLIVNPTLHPQLQLAALQLMRLQERGAYISSGEASTDDYWHYSLNLVAYTHFTSPIRRYPDLVVHRLLNAYIDDQPSLYSREAMKDIAAHCTDLAAKAKKYENAANALQVNVVMKSKPLVLYPVVESVDSDTIRLHYPTLRHITPRQGSISLSKLNLSQAALPSGEDNNQMTLAWQQRIYDIKKQQHSKTSGGARPVLDTNRFVVRVPAHLWHQLINAIIQEDQDRMLDIYDDISQEVEHVNKNPRCIRDLSSEMGGEEPVEHFVNFEATVGACSVLRVQMASSRLRGLVTPKIQLLSLTPTLDICLEHRSDPIHSFAEMSTILAAKQNYGSAESYRDSWLAALRMEAAVKALASDESAIVHSVPIVWRRKGDGSVFGIATLPLSFCVQRLIKFSSSFDPNLTDKDVSSNDTNVSRQPSYRELIRTIESELTYETRYDDYVCVRYSGVPIETPSDVANNIPTVEHEKVTWVGHCLVTNTTRDRKNDRLIVHMDLHQSAISIPNELLRQPENAPQRATIEWIAKTLPDRQMEKALCDLTLTRTTELARDIALGRNPTPLDTNLLTQLSDLTSENVPNLSAPNMGQEHAVRYSLTHPFSLIQGPPGTGKTVTGVRLTYLFTTLNHKFPGKPAKNGARAQVIYCGPSNKSVDVVASYLMKMGPSCPRLLRVYSERIEQQDFPLPHNPLPPRARHSASSTSAASDQELRNISLHHVIRKEDSPQAAAIRSWDAYFRNNPKEVTFSEVQDYQGLVANAQIQALKHADVILVTCTASASPKMLLGCNAKQVIIDECGMCAEPEALIPIVALHPQQVVLIGDHKQLRPVITNPAAKAIGLERSLFERYADKAQMLTTQYRMHGAIEEFPSTHFYQGRLECGREEQKKASNLKFWPGGKQKPLCFVHVAGLEESLSVSTTEGSEQSKRNEVEAQQAVRVATLLSRRFHVKAKDIVILTQYRAQCAEITKQLHQKGQDETSTSTIIASQGSEWDFVILSTVRSLPKSRIENNPTRGWILRNLGFITDQNQINVALTRAKKGLVIIGNKHLLRVDPMWKKLLHHYERQQKIVDAHEFMK